MGGPQQGMAEPLSQRRSVRRTSPSPAADLPSELLHLIFNATSIVRDIYSPNYGSSATVLSFEERAHAQVSLR